MKKLMALLVGATMVAGLGSIRVLGEEPDDVMLKAVLAEEMEARNMYEILKEKFPEVRQFDNLYRSEGMHIEHAKLALEEKGISYDDVKAKTFTLPETKEEAIKYALQYEIDDIKSLEARISAETDSNIKATLEMLLWGSQNHKNAMENALNGGTGNGVGKRGMMNFGRGRRNSMGNMMNNMMNNFRGRGMNSNFNGEGNFNCPMFNGNFENKDLNNTNNNNNNNNINTNSSNTR